MLAALLVVPEVPAAELSGPEALEEVRENLRRQDFFAALKVLVPLAEEKNASPEARSLLGEVYLKLGRPGEALVLLENLILEGEVDPTILLNAGRAALALGRRAVAIDYLEKGVAVRPVSPAAAILAGLRSEDGDYADAGDLLRPLVVGEVGETLAEQNPSMAAELNSRYAATVLRLGDRRAALASLRRVTELAPAKEAGWRLLGETLLELGEVDDAHQVLRRAQSLAEQRRAEQLEVVEGETTPELGVEVLIRQAHDLQQAAKYDDALATLRRAMAGSPNDPRPRVMEIRLLISMGRGEQALSRADKMVQIVPNHPEGYYLRGMARLSMQELVTAEADLRRVLELDPTHLASLNGLAILLMAKNAHAEAESVLLEVLRHWPGDELATRNLAKVRQRLVSSPAD